MTSTPAERANRKRQRERFRRVEHNLDATGVGPAWLRTPELARTVAEALHHRDGRQFDLHAYCIMPNHIHILFTPASTSAAGVPVSIAGTMHSLKTFTALRANRLLGRQGAFWAREYYDHYVRNEDQFEHFANYILENPVKAGLAAKPEDWPFSYRQA